MAFQWDCSQENVRCVWSFKRRLLRIAGVNWLSSPEGCAKHPVTTMQLKLGHAMGRILQEQRFCLSPPHSPVAAACACMDLLPSQCTMYSVDRGTEDPTQYLWIYVSIRPRIMRTFAPRTTRRFLSSPLQALVS